MDSTKSPPNCDQKGWGINKPGYSIPGKLWNHGSKNWKPLCCACMADRGNATDVEQKN